MKAVLPVVPRFLSLICILAVAAPVSPASAGPAVLVEAESFDDKGGWKVDPQFVQQMGSPMLLAHGLGIPVADASTEVTFQTPGAYRLWVRTRDWVPGHVDDPGRFQVRVDGVTAHVTFGTDEGAWHWQDGGLITITGATVTVGLHDLTGFDGRCDAIAFLQDPDTPPSDPAALAAWRPSILQEPPDPAVTESFDLVVVGGGIAGTCAAIAAAREGLSVALVQDRPFLGGNASQEVRVSTEGMTRHPIVASVASGPGHSNTSDGMIDDDVNRLQIVRAETNIHLYLPWRAYGVETNGAGRLTSVDARHIETGETRRLAAPLFVDSTGDGWIGYWAGAEYRMGREARDEFREARAPVTADRDTMGNSLMWTSRDTGSPTSFPAVAWALDVSGTASATSGGWNWEAGIHLNTIDDAEFIRDHLLRAIFGNFYNAKRLPGNANRALHWVPYIAGKRESRRLVGDHILTEDDVKNGVFFEDAVGMGSWTIDLHEQLTSADYRSTAIHTSVSPYYFPFRCLYSRDVPNLMMAGRCLSATHVGLGSPRVMNTGGQMGVAVGYAASVCKTHGIEPRDIYLSPARTLELQALIGGTWPHPSSAPPTMADIVDDQDANAVIVGSWTVSTHDGGYYGANYLHDGNQDKGSKYVRFTPELPSNGTYHVYLRWTDSNNRSTKTPVTILADGTVHTVVVNQQANGGTWFDLGAYPFVTGAGNGVAVRNDGTDGYVIADAVGFGHPLADTDDRDGDGLPNWWERQHFLGETAGMPGDDTDGDGQDNYAEYWCGTDPNDPHAYFSIRDLLADVGIGVMIDWPSSSNRLYTLEVTEDPNEAYAILASDIEATPPVNRYPVLASAATMFYRVTAQAE